MTTPNLMTSYELSSAARAELLHICTPAGLLDSFLQRSAYASDASFYALLPCAVVQPQTLTQIQSLMAWSQTYDIPLCFRAAGTSLSGQAVTAGVLVDISRHWRALEVRAEGAVIWAQPGVIGGHLNRVLRPFGRKIGPDPASLQACMLGGILANNASGMCCGVEFNAYHSLKRIKAVLPDGYIFDSGLGDADAQLQQERPQLHAGLQALRQRILSDADLLNKIRRKYKQKNTTGYSLNAFVDFETPAEILAHLLIGSEGTLGFIAEAELKTLPEAAHKLTGLLFFENVSVACAAVDTLISTAPAAIELMDNASLAALPQERLQPWLQTQSLTSSEQTDFHAAALLVEYHANQEEELRALQPQLKSVLASLPVLSDVRLSTEPAAQQEIWKLRKGLYPSVGAVRQQGSSVIIEDIVLPVAHLSAGIQELQQLFRQHGYHEAIIFGHAKEGNLHFVLTQSFASAEEIQRYQHFMDDVVALVLRFDGALKAEHGTGRNMAPFVEAEWGGSALEIMRELKALLDPRALLNPGVILNDDPLAHVRHLKIFPVVDAQIDACTECGFCEPVCPSRRLTLTPRQRIVLQRERARLETLIERETPSDGQMTEASGAQSHTQSGLVQQARQRLQALERDYPYASLQTCATDSLCALACPVGIDTGAFVKTQRRAAVPEAEDRQMAQLAERFKQLELGLKISLGAGKLGQTLLGSRLMNQLLAGLRKLLPLDLPDWHAQYPPPNLKALPSADKNADYVYFPSCLTRNLGYAGRPDLPHTLVRLARRGGEDLWVPPQIAGHCCGLPFSSKGYTRTGEAMRAKTLDFLADRAQGRPVIVDTSPCTHYLQQGLEERHAAELNILDSVAYLHRLAPQLPLVPRHARVVLHPVCSLQHMGLQEQLLELAALCAKEVVVPPGSGCCGYAGDRGLLFPELPEAALADVKRELAQWPAPKDPGPVLHCSSARSCEMGLSVSLEQDYVAITYLLANSLVWQK